MKKYAATPLNSPLLKRAVTVALCLGAFFGLKQVCLRQTEGFSLLAISSQRPYNPKWELLPPGEVQDAFDQPYTYFGCGAQSFVFFSKDQKRVLKFFKQDSFRLPFWLRLPLPWPFNKYQLKKRVSRQEKLSRDFSSYEHAYKHLKEETGLIYVHLNKTNSLKQTVTLVDPLGIAHRLKLDDYDFILQKKATMAYEQIDTLMKREEGMSAKEAISSLLYLIAKECRLKMVDRHPNIQKNFGFIDNKAVQIDIGRFKETLEKEGIEQMHREVGEWLKNKHPSLVEHFEKEYDLNLKTIL